MISFVALAVLAFVTGMNHVETGQADVREPVAIAASAGANQPVVLRRAADGMFYLDSHVGGVPLHLLVDTGASHTVLTRSDATRLGLSLEEGAGPRLSTAGGTVASTATMLPEMEIGGRRFKALDVAITDKGLPVSLAGQNVLARFQSLLIAGDTMTLR